MEKLVVQTKGSVKDPQYQDQIVSIAGSETSFTGYLRQQGIRTRTEDLVCSCHGNTPLSLELAYDLQGLANQGHRVVGTVSGGLLLGKGSIDAANAPTVPIISIPLNDDYFGGLTPFLAPMVPSGTADIGGVGLDRYDTAAYLTAEILNNTFEGVYTFHASDELKGKLKKWEIPVLGEAAEAESGIIVGEVDLRGRDPEINMFDFKTTFENHGTVGIFSPSKTQRPEAAVSLMRGMGKMNKSMYVRGAENIAIMAAKIMAMDNESIRNRLKQAAMKKAQSYYIESDNGKVEPGLTLEDFVGGE